MLDTVPIKCRTHLRETILRLLDHTATGEMTISLEQTAETQVAIAMELSSLLLEKNNPKEVWVIILKVLRLLPWVVDPELASVPCINRFFGGLQYASQEDEALFNRLAEMSDSQESWSSIVNHAFCQIKVNS